MPRRSETPEQRRREAQAVASPPESLTASEVTAEELQMPEALEEQALDGYASSVFEDAEARYNEHAAGYQPENEAETL